ncbi:MAG: acyl-CoA desaturase, partial [Chloroflexi bacterium]|nr:acyl-CoA desaturase [Chloroflexota bacterium]
MLRRSYGYYLVTSLALLLGFVAVGGMLAFLPGIGDAVAVLAIALLTVQVGFIGHDAGHNQIFQRTWHNRIVGNIAMPLLIGMSFESWTGKHNAHHSHTNEVGSDPDIEHSFLAFTPEQAAERRGLARWVVRHQARLYFVLAMGATIGFRIDAWSHAIHSFRDRTARWEVGLMAVNLVGWLVVPSLLLGPGRWLPIFAVSQLIIGVYMASVFAPNHKGMPLIRGERPGFLQQQVLTSRNVGGGPLVAFFYGGLNFQIEHHLFPNMARNKL